MPPRPRVWGTQFVMEMIDLEANNADLRGELPRARAAGIASVRTMVRWDQVEPQNTTPDRFDWRRIDQQLGAYSIQGIDLLVSVVGYPGWATQYGCGGRLLPGMEGEWREFMGALAKRYGKPPYRIAAWEIGNEPDGMLVIDSEDRGRPPGWGPSEPAPPYGGCWAGRAAEYKVFLQAAYESVKAVDPRMRVTLGGLAYVDGRSSGRNDFDIEFLDQLLAAGGGPYFDFFNYHWFPDFPFQPAGYVRHRVVTATLARYGYPKPIWLTETNRLVVPWGPTPEADQIRFLTQDILDVLAFSNIERIYWYGWKDYPPTVPDQVGMPQRGLIRADGSPKPALQVLPHVIRHTNGNGEGIPASRIHAYRFDWPRAAETHVIARSTDNRSASLTIPATAGRRVTIRSFPVAAVLAGRCCNERVVELPGGLFNLDVGPDPVFVEVGP